MPTAGHFSTKEPPPQEAQANGRSELFAAGAISLTVILWLLALVLPVWETRSNHSGEWAVVRGVLPAFIGWLGILAKCPAWFANLVLIPACIMLFKRSRGGFVLSLIALALAATAYILPAIYGDNDEAVIVGRLIGFYLWLGSFVILALAHALLATPTLPGPTVARIGVVMLMLLGIGGLERAYRVQVTPLERTLKTPNDLKAFTEALSSNPPQAEKDAALWWTLRQDLSSEHRAPSKRMEMLIAAGANPNQTNRYGDTLLMQSLPPHGSQALVELLLNAGADVNARDHRGKSVLDIAQEIGTSPECQQILANAGARSSAQQNGR